MRDRENQDVQGEGGDCGERAGGDGGEEGQEPVDEKRKETSPLCLQHSTSCTVTLSSYLRPVKDEFTLAPLWNK